MSTDTLAIDFGTSNSAAAMLLDGKPKRIPVENGADTLPSAVFIPANGAKMQIGMQATRSFIDGQEGRYMRALKSVLGSPLTHEKRLIGRRYLTIGTIVTAFLTALRERSEQVSGRRFTKVLSGRPVHFHSDDPQRDRQAEADLRACYLAAGFEEVAFLAEPEAAALVYRNGDEADGLGLIADMGGGTSDFTLFHSDRQRPQVLANHGIRLGGTDFDHALSMKLAMPLLGLGGQLRRSTGGGLLPVPIGPYSDLATWSQIPFLYTGETRRMIAEMTKLAVEPQKLSRLFNVIDMELGHDLAFAVERTKIDVNANDAPGAIDLGFLDSGLMVPVTPEAVNRSLEDMQTALREALATTLQMAEVEPQAIGRVILVGGSSLMGFVGEVTGKMFPQAQALRSEAFTAVVDGLALAIDR